MVQKQTFNLTFQILCQVHGLIVIVKRETKFCFLNITPALWWATTKFPKHTIYMILLLTRLLNIMLTSFPFHLTNDSMHSLICISCLYYDVDCPFNPTSFSSKTLPMTINGHDNGDDVDLLYDLYKSIFHKSLLLYLNILLEFIF